MSYRIFHLGYRFDSEYVRLKMFHMNLSPLKLEKAEHVLKRNNFKNQHIM